MKSTTRTEQKQRLREELKGQERRLTRAALIASDRKLTERFLMLKEVAAAETILLYCSMGAEPDTNALLEQLAARGQADGTAPLSAPAADGDQAVPAPHSSGPAIAMAWRSRERIIRW